MSGINNCNEFASQYFSEPTMIFEELSCSLQPPGLLVLFAPTPLSVHPLRLSFYSFFSKYFHKSYLPQYVSEIIKLNGNVYLLAVSNIKTVYLYDLMLKVGSFILLPIYIDVLL